VGDPRELDPLERLEKDVNAAIKALLSEMEIAARTPPMDACHPYECERRRKLVIRTVWALGRRLRPEGE
jgi:hypothetical protein